VTIHWGLDGIDRSNVDPWDVDDLGVLLFDNSFNILPAENQ